MSKLLTSRQVAVAVGVSQSSLKRWCDAGRVPSFRTAGGHRRLRLEDVLVLVRDGELHLQVPEALGLPATIGKSEWTLRRAMDSLTESLSTGNLEQSKLIATDLYVAGVSVSDILDQVFTPAMHSLGHSWETGSLEVYEERRAVNIVQHVVHDLRHLLPAVAEDAPVAIGGAPEGDNYTVPNSMVELTLQSCGWNATSLGGPVPFDSLASAVRNQSPRMFWLSVSNIAEAPVFVQSYNNFFDQVSQFGSTALVVGGQALTDEIRSQIRFASYCKDMNQLADFARAFRT